MTNTSFQIKQYNTVKDFLKETESILERDIVINTFPIWAATDLVTDTNPHPQYYSSIWCSDQLKYVFICVNNSGYIGWCGYDRQQDYTQTPTLTLDLQHTIQQLLAQCYERIGNTLQYIHGYTTLAFYFYEQWKTLTAPNYTKAMDKHVYDHQREQSVWCFELSHPTQLIYKSTTHQLLPTSSLRLATTSDIELLVTWMNQFMIDCHLPLNDGDTRELCVHDIQQQHVYLWCINDQPVGTIWKRRALKRNVVSLAYVFVPKEHRSKGYAAAMVTQFSLLLFENYQCLTLLMDGRRNPLQNLYASVGYKPIGSFARLQI